MMPSKAVAKKISAWLVKVRKGLLISEPVSKPMLKKQMLGLKGKQTILRQSTI